MNNTLEFDGIEKSFDGQAVLSSVYMKCVVGKITGLMGRNGSGKSTLMKIVFGTMDTTFKSIRLDGKAVTGNYLKQRLIGYLPQSHFIRSDMTVHRALDYYKISPDWLISHIPSFEVHLGHSVNKLSGGFLRMLEAALIIKSDNRFVMLDEPFSGLMPLHIEVMKKIIQEEKRSKGIIISDHLFRHTIDLADEVYLLTTGKTYLINDRNDLVRRGYLEEDCQ